MTDRHAIPAIGKPKPGEHRCCIYETDEEQRQVVIPFVRQGLQQGEKVLYIADALSAQKVLRHLQDDGLDPEPYQSSGQLVILTGAEAYTRDGVFDPDGMIAFLRAQTKRSLEEGYAALRVSGEMTWALRDLPHPQRLLEYETKLNGFFPGNKCLALCQYDRRRFQSAQLLDVLRTHPHAWIGTQIHDNYFYIPPDELSGADPATAQLDRCIEQLERRGAAEKALQQSELLAHALLNATADLATVADAQGNILDVNEAMARLWNAPPEDLIGINAWELLPRDVAARWRPYSDQVFEYGKPVRFEAEWDGKWFETVVYPVADAHGVVTTAAVHARDITERVNADKALRESEATARALLDGHTDFAAVLDTGGTILDVNEVMARSFGKQRDEMIGVYGWGLIPPDLAEQRKAYADKVIRSGKPVRFEDERQGTHFDNVFFPILDAQGTVTRIAVHARDITERVRSELALRESELMARALLTAHTDFALVLDTKGTIRDVNDAMAQRLGGSRDELIGENVWELLPPDVAERRKAHGDEAIQSGKLVRFEDEHGGKWFDNVCYPVLDERGEVTILAVHARDISERVRAEMELQQAKDLFETTFAAQRDAILLLDAQRPPTIIDCNPATEEVFGYTREEMVGRKTTFLHVDESGLRDYEEILFKAVEEHGFLHELEAPLRHKDGSVFPGEHSVMPIVDKQGRRNGWIGVVRNIAARVQAEKALREAKELFEAIFTTQRDAILLLDAGSPPKIIDCNPATEKIFGYTREEMLGRTTAFLHVDAAWLREFQRHLDLAVKQHRYLHLLEFQMKRKDGMVFPSEHNVMPMQDGQGNRTGWVGVVRDITERVRTNEEARQHREQLAHIMRVASMGVLTASLAHELNQPLTAVVSNAQAAQRFLTADNPDLNEVSAALADIAENGLRAGNVIRGLRALLRKGEPKQEPLDVNEIVREVVPLVQGEALLNSVSIELKLADDLPTVFGDRIQLEQVVLNLLLNGIESLKKLETGVRVLTVRTEKTAPGAVELSVLDSGAGLDEGIKHRIFDPFFSTKTDGLGMGLTINRSIVRAHNGHLWAADNPGGGAAFHVRLPVSQ